MISLKFYVQNPYAKIMSNIEFYQNFEFQNVRARHLFQLRKCVCIPDKAGNVCLDHPDYTYHASSAEETTMMLHSTTFDTYSRPQRPRQLVRQMATTTESNSAENSTLIEDKRLRVSGGRMPSRQWTTDASFSENHQTFLSNQYSDAKKANSTPVVMSSTSNAFLLRPVSRNSTGKQLGVMSSNPAGGDNSDALDLKSPAAKAAIAAAVAAAKGNGGGGPNDIHSLGPEFRSCPSNGTLHSRGMILRKQRTTESAPTSHLIMSAGGTLKQYPR